MVIRMMVELNLFLIIKLLIIKPGETTNDILKRGLKTQLGVYSTNPNYVKDIKKIYNSNMEKVKQPELPKIYLKK